MVHEKTVHGIIVLKCFALIFGLLWYATGMRRELIRREGLMEMVETNRFERAWEEGLVEGKLRNEGEI